jgi:hypothetical protein
MDAFTPNEPVYTFDNQLAFNADRGRQIHSPQKTQTAAGDSGVPPLYTYSGAGQNLKPLWKDYFSTADEATTAVSGYPWFTSTSRPSSLSMFSSRRHLLDDPASAKTGVIFTYKEQSYTFDYIGVCHNTDGTMVNGYVRDTNDQTCSGSYSNGVSMAISCKQLSSSLTNPKKNPRVCKCFTNDSGKGVYCNSDYPVCQNSFKNNRVAGCYQAGAGTGSASIMAA